MDEDGRDPGGDRPAIDYSAAPLGEGVVSAGEADLWLRGLEAASRTGSFFSAATVFIVSGRKP